jgi:hypothetical protein
MVNSSRHATADFVNWEAFLPEESVLGRSAKTMEV